MSETNAILTFGFPVVVSRAFSAAQPTRWVTDVSLDALTHVQILPDHLDFATAAGMAGHTMMLTEPGCSHSTTKLGYRQASTPAAQPPRGHRQVTPHEPERQTGQVCREFDARSAIGRIPRSGADGFWILSPCAIVSVGMQLQLVGGRLATSTTMLTLRCCLPIPGPFSKPRRKWCH